MGLTLQTKCIFVIHSECDNHIITQLENYFDNQLYINTKDNILTKFNIKYLDSKTGNYVGEDFVNLIRKHFSKCYYYLIILTNNSKDRQWVNQEIGFAHAISKKRCIVMLEDSLRGKSFGFIHTNYDVQYFDPKVFSINEKGDEIKKISNKIVTKFGIRFKDFMKGVSQTSIIQGLGKIGLTFDNSNGILTKGGKEN
jgi:hypothetical protein